MTDQANASEPSLSQFFRITVPEDEEAKDWAECWWDTYGFDYHAERSHDRTVYAWSFDDDVALAETLRNNDIEFKTFWADAELWFAYDAKMDGYWQAVRKIEKRKREKRKREKRKR